MFYQTNQITQAEFKVFEAKFKHRPAPEGVTIVVPNVFERVWMALRNALAMYETGQRAGEVRVLIPTSIRWRI